MFSLLRQTVSVFVVLTLITGVAYPLVMTGIAQIVFPHQANGSLIVQDDRVVGSELIGQQFDDPKYFWSRPSAASPAYNGAASTGSNYGPTNPAQLDAVKSRVENLRQAHPDQTGPIPIDLVTASGSGLDPHISPAAAEYQVSRVARSRGIDIAAVRNVVLANTEGRTLGFLGEPRVNVLRLNRVLDELQLQTEQRID
jgi:K+-transporting ATPase ATPase C chain